MVLDGNGAGDPASWRAGRPFGVSSIGRGPGRDTTGDDRPAGLRRAYPQNPWARCKTEMIKILPRLGDAYAPG